ncbi:MAG: hypothetical protein K2G85_05655 [Muribaculaceae bacterium]|nr:hypothetical protein [Muribaculaceae bacterium]
MEGKNENIRFKCAFSEKAIKNNTLTMIIFIITLTIILFFSTRNSANTALSIWINLSYIVFVVLMSVVSFFCLKRMSRGSYLEITTDGILKCVYKGRKEVNYPINEIRSIEESSFKDARKKYATVPIVLNNRGDDLYPPEGVLITFNRAWIKSIFPVYFNPEDRVGFISAINERIKTAEEGSKFDEKD